MFTQMEGIGVDEKPAFRAAAFHVIHPPYFTMIVNPCPFSQYLTPSKEDSLFQITDDYEGDFLST